MLRSEGETRPKCHPRDHQWVEGRYLVDELRDGTFTVVREKTCARCGRIVFHSVEKSRHERVHR